MPADTSLLVRARIGLAGAARARTPHAQPQEVGGQRTRTQSGIKVAIRAMPESHQTDRHSVTVSFDTFGWESLAEEARTRHVSVEDLIVHAALAYLADQDAERMSRQPLRLQSSER